MAGATGAGERTHEIVVFTVGGLPAALPAGSVEGVLSGLDIAPVRALPAGMLGSFEFRGQRGAVADLHWRLGLGRPHAGSDHRYLIVSIGQDYAALRVDDVEGRLSIQSGAFEMLSVPGSGEGLGYLRGVIRREGVTIPLMDPELLVSAAAVREITRRGTLS